jgi:hypothetical protein
MTRRARIRAFLLGLLIGGGTWSAAAHDETVVPEPACNGVVADCPDGESAQTVERIAPAPPFETSTGSTQVKTAGLPATLGRNASILALTTTQGSNRTETREFVRGVLAIVGKQMSGPPRLGLLSGSS